MKVNFVVEDAFFFRYIGCATAAKSLFRTLSSLYPEEWTYNGSGRGYDIVHCHTFGPIALLLRRMGGGTSVLTAHSTPRTNAGNLALSRGVNLFYPPIYGSFDHIITISESCDNEIHAMLPHTPTTLIPNGVDREYFREDPGRGDAFRKEFGIPPDARIILTVAQQTPRKGIYDFLALGRMHPEWYWVWVGGFPYGLFSKDYLRIGRCKEQADSNMIFTGFVPDIIGAYSAADVFLMPSHAETFGLVILEALSMGLPVIARDIPEFREIFGDTLLYFSRPDEVGGHLADDRLLAARAGLARAATEKFDIRTVASMHMDLYRALAGEK
jgi:1,2-diacylglycerol-3-alpha-glucose alpha-1,2-galactosyltransferase